MAEINAGAMPERMPSRVRKPLLRRIYQYRCFYILLLPAAVLMIIFSYVPMYGAILAFKEFDFSKGILRSPWAAMGGMKHFTTLSPISSLKRHF